jgi:hypothetical protein
MNFAAEGTEINVRFQVLAAASVKMTVFCVVAACSLVAYRRFRDVRLHHQGLSP